MNTTTTRHDDDEAVGPMRTLGQLPAGDSGPGYLTTSVPMSSAMNDRQAAMLRAVVGNARPANAWEQRQYALEDQRREVRKQVQLQGARFALLKAQLRALGATRL